MSYAKARCHDLDASELCALDRLIVAAIYASTERPSRRRYFGAWIDFTRWLGRKPNVRESAAMSRALTRLERAGLSLRLPGRRVVLTRAGHHMADALNSEPPITVATGELIELPSEHTEYADEYEQRYGDPEAFENLEHTPVVAPPPPKRPRLKLSEMRRAKQ